MKSQLQANDSNEQIQFNEYFSSSSSSSVASPLNITQANLIDQKTPQRVLNQQISHLHQNSPDNRGGGG